MNRTRFAFLLAGLLGTAVLYGAQVQYSRTLYLEQIPVLQQRPILTPVGDYGVLLVECNLPKFEMRTTNTVISKSDSVPGVYIWYLAPGMHVITFRAEGYVPLKTQLVMSTEKAKQVRQYRISETVLPTSNSVPQLVLHYTKRSPDEKIYGLLDDNVLTLDFKDGTAILQPPFGPHHLKVHSTRGSWEDVVVLDESNRTVDRAVVLDTSRTKVKWDMQTAVVYIKSEPESARVIINHVVQGYTPWFSMNVPIGYHRVDIVKDNYYPYTFGFQIDSLSKDELGAGAGQEIIQFPACPLMPRYAALRISSDPVGAKVLVDGQPKGLTPIDSLPLEPGTHKLRLEAPNHYPFDDEVTVSSDTVIVVRYSLRDHCGRVDIRSVPADGATVMVNGKEWGLTPLTRDSVLCGNYQVLMRKSGYSDTRFTMPVQVDSLFSTNELLEQTYAQLSLNTEPRGAAVTVKGPTVKPDRPDKPLTTPASKLKLLSGLYILAVAMDFYDPWSHTLWLEAGAKLDTTIKLVRHTGAIEIFCDTPGADVFLNGKKVATTPADGSVCAVEYPTGDYTLTVKKKGLTTYKNTITIPHKGKVTVRPKLAR